MKKKAMMSRLGMLILGLIVVLVFIVGFVGGKGMIMRTATTFSDWISNMVFGSKTPNNEPDKIPEDVLKSFENLVHVYRNSKGEECRMKHEPLSTSIDDYNIEILRTSSGTSFRLKNNLGKTLLIEKVGGRFPCVIGGIVGGKIISKNFIKYYLEKDEAFSGEQMYISPMQVIITDNDEIVYETYDTAYKNRGNMFLVDESTVCFIPTTGWNLYFYCRATNVGMDDNCMAEFENKIDQECAIGG